MRDDFTFSWTSYVALLRGRGLPLKLESLWVVLFSFEAILSFNH